MVPAAMLTTPVPLPASSQDNTAMASPELVGNSPEFFGLCDLQSFCKTEWNTVRK